MWDISRRRFMQSVAATAVASTTGQRAVAAPQRGGHLRIGLAGGTSSDSLDPSVTQVDSGFLVLGASKSTLIEIAPNGDVVPLLAERWEPSDDLTRWVFDIRAGATFHSGKTVTAEDVVASLNLHRGDASTSPGKSILGAITDIRTDGTNRVVISLDSPNVDFPSLLRTDYFVILPSRDGTVIDRATMDGTGPYVLEGFEPGQHMRFVRNPNYWDLDNQAHLDSAEALIIPDAAARMNALRSGQVDLINAVDLKAVDLLRRVPGIRIENIPTGLYYSFSMMTDVAPFNDINVRKALKYAINRQELVDKVLLGYGTVANDHPLSPRSKYFNPNLPQREYDPDQARFHLREAGLESLEVPLSVAEIGFPGSPMAGVLYAAAAATAGITVTVTREPDDGYFGGVWLTKPFTAAYWNEPITPDVTLTAAFASNSPYNDTHFNNPRFDELLINARRTADDATRIGMYHEMQQIIYEDGGLLNPMFANYVWAMKDSVKRPDAVTTVNDLDSFRLLSRWWIE